VEDWAIPTDLVPELQMNGLPRRTAPGRCGAVIRVSAMAACACISLSASAQQFSAGVAAGAARAKADCVATYPCDRSSTQAKLFAAYRFANDIELKAMLFDAGHVNGGDTSPLGTAFGGRFRVAGVAATAGYRWSFAPDWSLGGQLGIASVRTVFDHAPPFTGQVRQTTAQPLAGLSLGYTVAPHWLLSVDYDETRFKAHTTRGSLRMLGLAAHCTF
jgi:hypothetical protein